MIKYAFKSLAFKHWAAELTLATNTFTHFNFVTRGFKSFSDINEKSEHVRQKKMYCFAPTFGPVDYNLLVKLVATDLNPTLMHRSSVGRGDYVFMHQLQWPIDLQYSPATYEF